MIRWNLETVAQIATIIAAFAAVASPDVRRFYGTSVAIPAWILVAAAVGVWIGLSRVRVAQRIGSESPAGPIRVDAGKLHSAVPLSSEPLKSSAGGYSVWVYLHQFGQGIRHVENNRYIFGHASHHGGSREIEGNHKYFNVFALSNSPTRGGLIWKVWVANDRGQSFNISAADAETYGEGWHHFVVRWDRHRPILELLIDGVRAAVSQSAEFNEHWPVRIEDTILVGTWPNRAPVHFINTLICRPRGFAAWPDDETIALELRTRPIKTLHPTAAA